MAVISVPESNASTMCSVKNLFESTQNMKSFKDANKKKISFIAEDSLTMDLKTELSQEDIGSKVEQVVQQIEIFQIYPVLFSSLLTAKYS